MTKEAVHAGRRVLLCFLQGQAAAGRQQGRKPQRPGTALQKQGLDFQSPGLKFLSLLLKIQSLLLIFLSQGLKILSLGLKFLSPQLDGEGTGALRTSPGPRLPETYASPRITAMASSMVRLCCWPVSMFFKATRPSAISASPTSAT